MGRDIASLRQSSVKAKPHGVSNEADRGIYSKTSREGSEAKVNLVKEGTTSIVPQENCIAKHDILGAKSPNLEDVKNDIKSSKVQETKSGSPEKSGLEMTSFEKVETKHIIQKPLDSTGYHLACSTPIAAETLALSSQASPSANILQSLGSSKKSQLKTPFVSRKLLDDEDNWSMASSHRTNASVMTTRSRTTVPVAPKFSVTGRLEKRKEFFEKLQEKHKALEEEKREYEARNKEEEQAAIKQLRKSMMYKAKPVPNFYYEGPPPKKELKKVPTTRAVSPKLGRRKSCGDALHIPSSRIVRHSLGNLNENQKPGYVTPTSSYKTKVMARGQSSVKPGLRKERPKQQAKEPSPAKEAEAAQTVGTVPEAEDVATAGVPRNMIEQPFTDISAES